MQLQHRGIRPLPCTGLQDGGAKLIQGWQQVLETKAAALLSAAKAQVVQRTTYKLQPSSDALAVDIFSPLGTQLV